VATPTLSFDRPQLDGTTPQPEVRELILKQEAVLVRYELAGRQAGLDKLLADGISYLYENGRVSNKEEFFRDDLSEGYIDARHQEIEPMRQFGSLVTTVSYGYFRLKLEGEYPARSVVTYLRCKTTQGDWVLVHRGECHDGNAINNQLPQEGGPVNLSHLA
jgi:hypothetical protein